MRKFYTLTGIPKFDYALKSLDNHLAISSKAIQTRKAYSRSLNFFMTFSRKLPDECKRNELINIIMEIKKNRGFGNSGLKHYIYGVRYYLKNIAHRMDLYIHLPTPVRKHYDVEILNVHEMNLLFRNCRNIRNLFIIQLLYETGIRIGELLSIKYHDFDLHHKSLTILNSKNRKTRTVYFGTQLKTLIEVYHLQNKSLFSNTLDNKDFHPFVPLSRGGIRFMMNSLVKRSGVKKNVTPHLLRHAFAVHYLNFGGTIYQLQKLLGHSHLVTTFNYLQYAILPESLNISILDKLLNATNNHQLKLLRA